MQSLYKSERTETWTAQELSFVFPMSTYIFIIENHRKQFTVSQHGVTKQQLIELRWREYIPIASGTNLCIASVLKRTNWLRMYCTSNATDGARGQHTYCTEQVPPILPLRRVP